MLEVSLFRLYLLRALYLLMGVGLALHIGPQILMPDHPWTLWHGVGCAFLSAMCVLAFLGLRYPLKMLPLLFFEFAWKLIWLAAIALPLWMAHHIDEDTAQTVLECLMGVLVPIAVPWRYVVTHFVKAPGDRWR